MREGDGEGMGMELGQPLPCRSPPAGRVQDPCAAPLALGRRSGVSAKTSREGVF